MHSCRVARHVKQCATSQLKNNVIVFPTKDRLREARHCQKSPTGKMYAVLKSTEHKSRGIPSLQVADLEKIDAPRYTPSDPLPGLSTK